LGSLKTAHEEDAASRGVTLREDVADDIGSVEGDAERLSQATGHILANAIQHGSDDGEILLTAQRDNGNVQIIISDNGPGMSKAQISEVTNTEPRDGPKDGQSTGLGLPLAKQLIEAHGGSFEIQSKMNVGTSVIITLPAA